jgi:hypothetical protein
MSTFDKENSFQDSSQVLPTCELLQSHESTTSLTSNQKRILLFNVQ